MGTVKCFSPLTLSLILTSIFGVAKVGVIKKDASWAIFLNDPICKYILFFRIFWDGGIRGVGFRFLFLMGCYKHAFWESGIGRAGSASFGRGSSRRWRDRL
jgi:hypothetical protein